MEIMLSHFGIRMAYNALDGLNIYAQRLHLRHIGVAAAIRSEQANIASFLIATQWHKCCCFWKISHLNCRKDI